VAAAVLKVPLLTDRVRLALEAVELQVLLLVLRSRGLVVVVVVLPQVGRVRPALWGALVVVVKAVALMVMRLRGL
jgi:hypothetical protein